jgi:hypothetical protein
VLNSAFAADWSPRSADSNSDVRVGSTPLPRAADAVPRNGFHFSEAVKYGSSEPAMAAVDQRAFCPIDEIRCDEKAGLRTECTRLTLGRLTLTETQDRQLLTIVKQATSLIDHRSAVSGGF